LAKWVLGRRKQFKVYGPSMMPTLKAGQHALVKPRFRPKSLKAGAIVVLKHPKQQGLKLIKRIQKNDGGEKFFVQGDNLSATTDSRDFGPVPAELIIGQVTSVMA
jgi:nickel-type superoxide dismutase maturation protease